MEKAIQNLERMAETKNYNRWIYNTIQPFLGSRILEIGCGIGNMTQFFLNCEMLVAIDNSLDCIRIINSRFPPRENFKILNYDIRSEKIQELRKFNFNTVICINVLEHIKDDFKALNNCYRLLNEKGKLILFAPDFKFLYGSIDRADYHYRRYNSKELSAKLRGSGFIIEKKFYVNMLGILPWILHGKILKTPVHPRGQMLFFDKFVPLYALLERVFSPPLGLSLVFVCKKD